MPENLPTHTHCLECDSAIPVGRPYCSDDCQRSHQARARKERNKNLFFVVVAVAAVILIALMSGLL